MIRKQFVVGPLQCNCTILTCEKAREAVVIDPGDEGARLVEELKSQGVTVKYLLHTHAHFDHIGATRTLKENFTTKICLHRGDEKIYQMLPVQGQMFGMRFDEPKPIDQFIEDGELLTFGEHRLEVIHTPGHSPGGVCFKLSEKEQLLFSGDTLFQGSIGRTDLWGGNYDTLLQSIRTRLLSLDGDTQVFPGHGGETLISTEKRHNPFLH